MGGILPFEEVRKMKLHIKLIAEVEISEEKDFYVAEEEGYSIFADFLVKKGFRVGKPEFGSVRWEDPSNNLVVLIDPGTGAEMKD